MILLSKRRNLVFLPSSTMLTPLRALQYIETLTYSSFVPHFASLASRLLAPRLRCCCSAAPRSTRPISPLHHHHCQPPASSPHSVTSEDLPQVSPPVHTAAKPHLPEGQTPHTMMSKTRLTRPLQSCMHDCGSLVNRSTIL